MNNVSYWSDATSGMHEYLLAICALYCIVHWTYSTENKEFPEVKCLKDLVCSNCEHWLTSIIVLQICRIYLASCGL